MEELVQNLDNCDRNEPESIYEIITQINTYYVHLADYRKIDQDLAYTFPQSEGVGGSGILEYVKSQITLKPHDKCREQCFQLMEWIIENESIPKVIRRQYIVRFKEISDLVWKNQKERARVQSAALDVLIKLFSKFGYDFKPQELEASQLYYQLISNSEKSAFQPTVRGLMFHLCGILAKLYVNDFMSNKQLFMQLFKHLVETLKAEVNCSNRHLQLAILHGSISGLNEFLSSFSSKLHVDTAQSNTVIQDLYELTVRVVNPGCSIAANSTETVKLKRRDFQRAALDLIARNGQIFEKHLAQHYETWFEDLLTWAKSNNIEDHRVGLNAVFKFLESITSFHLHTTEPKTNDNSKTGVNEDTNTKAIAHRKSTAKFFVGRFRSLLESRDSQGREITVAVKGYGIISQLCEDEEFSDDLLFSRIVKRVEGILGEMDGVTTGREKFSKYGSVSLLPLYVDSIGRILFSMKVKDEESLAIFHGRLLNIEELSIALIIHYPKLSEKYQMTAAYSFDRVASSLYQRHFKYLRHYLEKVIQEGLSHVIASPTKTELDILTETYINIGNEKEFKKLNLYSVESYVKFWVGICEINKQRINQTPWVEMMYDSVIRWSLETIGKLDLSVEFVDADAENENPNSDIEVLDPVYSAKARMCRDFQLFINLIEFLDDFILQTPLKLFEKWIIILPDIFGFIQKFPLAGGFYKIVRVIFEAARKLRYFEEDNQEARQVLESCSKFLTSSIVKVEEFRDDLLLNVLNVWLTAPEDIIINHVPQLEGMMKTVLRIGKTCFAVTHHAIETMIRWFETDGIEMADKERLFQALYPLLKAYFTSAGQEDIVEVVNTKSSRDSVDSKKLFKKSKTQHFQKRLEKIRDEKKVLTLRELQLSILNLCGSYGHFLNLNDSYSIDTGMNVEERYLKYSIPFQDTKPDIHLEQMLPRILDLCNHASERQIRAASSECLHSLVLYFLGHSVHSTSPSDHSELFIKLFHNILKLGCDADGVIRQLFNPLAVQIVHWYSRIDAQFYGEIVLRIIADNLTQVEDANLRDFSAVCLAEFFSWSVKHGNSSMVKQTMKTLCAMGTHSALKYRQGSIIGFNSIYREFRENDDLVNVYTFLLVHCYITSLCLPYDYELSGDSILNTTTRQALQHLERIMIKKKDRFNTNVQGRIPLAELEGPCLKDLVLWLLKQSGLSMTAVGRMACLELFDKLTPHIRGLEGTTQLLLDYEKKMGESGIIRICENVPANTEDLVDELFKAVLASSEIYLALSPFHSVAKLLKHPESQFILLLTKLSQHESSYFIKWPSLLVKIGETMNTLTSSFTSNLVETFFKLSLIVSKNVRRSDYQNILRVFDKLFGTLVSLNTVTNSFVDELRGILMPCDFLENVKKPQSSTENNHTTQWLTEILNGSHLPTVLSKSEKENLANGIWNSVHSSLYCLKSGENEIWVTQYINFRQQELIQNLLILAFRLGFRDNVIHALFDNTPVLCTELKHKAKLTKGEIFQQFLLPAFCFNEELVDFRLLQKKAKLEKIGFLIDKLLAFLRSERDLRKMFGTRIVASILEIWQPLHLNCDPTVVGRVVSGLTVLDLNFCRSSKELCDWWHGVMTNSNLSLKEKSEFVHFVMLFGMSPDPEIMNQCVNAMSIMVEQGLKITLNLDWSNEEQHIAKVFLKLLNLYECLPENMELVSILVQYVSKTTSMIDYQVENERNKSLGGSHDKCETKPPKNICAIEISCRLRKIVGSLTESFKVKIARTIFDTIRSAEICQTNLAANKFCLIPVVGTLTQSAARKYFSESIYDIIQEVEANTNTSSSISVSHWNRRTIAMCQVEMLALKTSAEFIQGQALNDAYLQKTNPTTASSDPSASDKKLFRKLMEISQRFRSTPVPSQRDMKLRYANYNFNSASFNSSVALCKATKLGIKHFTGFIFRQKSESDNIWANLIDMTTQYKFPIVMDVENEKKITDEKLLETRASSATSLDVNKIFQQSNRVAIAESSLGNDASRFDFTTSIRVATSPFYQKVYAGVNPHKHQPKPPDVELVTPQGASIEWSMVNEHPCMFSFISALKAIMAFPAEAEEWPQWAKELKSILERRTIHPNVKAFVVGGILNLSDAFKQYAQHFIQPILSLIINDSFPTSGTLDPEEKSQPQLNHFVKDITIMLLSWSDVSKPPDNLVKQTLEYFMGRSECRKRSDIQENNLQIFESIISHWIFHKDADVSVTLPYDEDTVPVTLISQCLQKDDPKFGLSLAKCFCLAGVLPCLFKDVANFIDKLSISFKSATKSIYTLAGEVAGLLFKVLESLKFPCIDKAMQRMKEKKLDKEKSRAQSYLLILSSVGRSFPTFLVLFKNDIFFFLKNPVFRDQVIRLLVDSLKEEMKIETVQSKKNELFQNLFADLDGRGIFSTELKNEFDAGIDFLGLLMTAEIVKKDEKIRRIMIWTQEAEFSPQREIRLRYASMISDIYKHFGGHKDTEISTRAEKMFIRLLADPELKSVVEEFWFGFNSLKSSSTPLLLLELIEILYDTQKPLEVSIDLMMRRCSSSPDYAKFLFDSDLADCNFTNYEINTSWRNQASLLQPLFAESFSTSQNLSLFPKSFQDSISRFKNGTRSQNILCTLRNMQFSQTQTQERIHQFGESSSIQSMPMDVDEHFDFGFDQSVNLPSPGDPTPANNPLDSLRKRFYEKPDTAVFAIREVQRQQTQIASEIEEIKSRKGGVKLNRKYRIGELPDILIKNSELLGSFSALAAMDDELAKTVFVLLVSSFVKEMGEGEITEFKHNASIVLSKLLSKYGTLLNAQFTTALLEVTVILEIPINVTVVTNIAKRFGLERLAVLNFEQRLTKESYLPTPAKRPKVLEETSKTEIWQNLAELYKQLDDFDAVRSAFLHIHDLHNGNSHQQFLYEKARQALYYESLSKFVDAQKTYEEILESNSVDTSLVHFADDALYKVLRSLSEWDSVFTRCQGFCDTHKEELHTEIFRDRILPVQLSSGLQSVLRHLIDPMCHQVDFLGFMEMLKEDTEWKTLAERLAADMSIVYFLDGEENRSHSLLDVSLNTLLNSFQSFERLSKIEQRECFLDLQKTSALGDALGWMKALTSDMSNIEEKTTSLIEKWRRVTSSTHMPLLTADIIMSEKSAFLRLILEKMENMMLESKEDLCDDIARLQFEQMLCVVKISSLNGNADVGNHFLGMSKMIGEGCEETELLKWRGLLCELLTTCDTSYSMKDWLKQWSSSWKKLGKLEKKGSDPSVWKIQADLLQSLITKIFKQSDNLPKKYMDQLYGAFSISEDSRNYAEMVNTVRETTLTLIGKATGDEESSQGQDIVSTSGEAAIKLYELTKALLEKFPEYKNSIVLHEKLVLCLLSGLKNRHKLAMQLFPSCFGVLEKFPTLIESLSGQLSNLPSWIFLPWLDQIVTYYKQKPVLAPFLRPIIQTVLVDFPQAFYLQFCDLDLIKSSPLPTVFGCFRDALKALVLPDIHFRAIIITLRSKKDLNELREYIRDYVILELETIRGKSDFYGKIHIDYVNEIYKKVQDVQNALDSANQEDLIKIQRDLIAIFYSGSSPSLQKNLYNTRQGMREPKKFLNLEDLSPWLAKFHFANFKDGIEVPGLYSSFKKPEINMHPNIVAFESTVKIYESNSKAIGITAITNSRKYSYIMKSGDDLRQDNRIQRIFTTFNELFKGDTLCRERDLNLLTYSVIPISKSFGMIEVVRKTMSLKQFILNSSKHDINYSRSCTGVASYILKLTGTENRFHSYGILAGRNRSDIETLFSKAASCLPKTLFRDNVFSSAESLQTYFLLREKLIRSYATLCIVHYLLGIGDRHLHNVMIKLDTGRFLGIDFGHAFGSATATLLVPELVPFRLTTQFQGLFAPTGEKGLFKETMLHSWRAIVKSSELIMSLLTIFIAEPTVDWSRRKLTDETIEQSSTTTSHSSGELPVQLLLEKLKRGNPIEISNKLLEINEFLRSNKTYSDNWKKVLLDGREDMAKKSTLNDEEMIDLLISIASDKNILCRTYVGWSAWV